MPDYATISRQWQYAIEYQTFREITVKSTEIETLSRIVINHRPRLLKQIKLNVILPTYTDADCAIFETEEDKQANDNVFTKAIKDLFALLGSWYDETQPTENGSDTAIGQSLRLCLGDCYSPKAFCYRRSKKYWEDHQEWKCGRRDDLFKRRYESSLLRLESTGGVRKLPHISSFYTSTSHRKVEPRSLALIASRFPKFGQPSLEARR